MAAGGENCGCEGAGLKGVRVHHLKMISNDCKAGGDAADRNGATRRDDVRLMLSRWKKLGNARSKCSSVLVRHIW